MSNQIFPSLPGFDIKVNRTPVFATLVQPTASGKELRASFQSYPRYRYALTLNFVRQAGFSAKTAYDEAATLNAFFMQHRGAWDSFLFADPYDSSDTGMGFGVGNGTTTAFQLQRREPGRYTNVLGTFTIPTTPRTNMGLQSQTLNTGWSQVIGGTGVAPVVTANYGVAPDGTPTSDRVTFNQGAGVTSADYSLLYCPATSGLTIGGQYTMSIWLKSNTGPQTIYLAGGSMAAASAVVNLTTSWQRFTLTFTAAAASGTGGFGLRGTATTGATADIQAWGWQIEPGATATDYIPTTSAAVTVTPSYYPGTDGFEPVTEPAPGLLIYKNGTLLAQGTDWTLGASGTITFTVAPASGAVLTWTGSYYRRVRFDGDELEMERLLSGAWDGKTVKLISIK